MSVSLGCEIAVLQFPSAPPVIFAQTLFPQQIALAVLLIRLVEPVQPVQPAGTTVQCIQPQLFSGGADISILLSIIGKGISFQLHIGTIIGRLGPTKKVIP